MLELKEIMEYHDSAYDNNQSTRERAADDLVFYWVSQWSDSLFNSTDLEFRGSFDILRKAGRDIITKLKENPVSLSFHPVDVKNDEAEQLSETMSGLYMSDELNNISIEAKENALSEAIVCGFGAYKMETKYEYNRLGKKRQKIYRIPIHEANNTVFFDANAQLLDKSDARFASVLTPYSEDGYKELVHNLTGQDMDDIIIESNFDTPEQSYTFPWISEGSDRIIYVTEFYHRESVKDKRLKVIDPFGSQIELLKSDFDDEADDLEKQGYHIIDEVDIKRNKITKYIASGKEILAHDELACDFIPVIPVYGERTIIEGEEHYEGLTRLGKDPQALRNFQLSYLADIVSRSPRPKAMFYPEQIKGFEFMYDKSGADNNYPYLLQNQISVGGVTLPGGPAGVMPEQSVPQALMASIELSRQAVEDVANPGTPQDIADPELSGKAVYALEGKIDQQAMIFQQNYEHAIRRDGQVYASYAGQVYSFPREVTVTAQDGSQSSVKLMESVIDEETGESKTINDLTGIEFSIYSKVSSNYGSRRQMTIDTISEMMQHIPPQSPLFNILMLKQLELMDGVNFDDVRKMARKQLIAMDVQEPKTPQEKKEYQELKAQQEKQPDPNQVALQLQQAQLQLEQAKIELQQKDVMIKAQAAESKALVDQYNARTQRERADVEAVEAGVKVRTEAFRAASDMARATAETHLSVGDLAHQLHKTAIDSSHKDMEHGMQAEQQQHDQQMAEKQMEMQQQQAQQQQQQSTGEDE